MIRYVTHTGIVTLIDDEDLEDLDKYKWYVQRNEKTGSPYVCRTEKIAIKNYNTIALHRHLLGLKKGDKRQVDHINKDTLDNRKSNLRIVDTRGNSWNRRGQSEHGPCIKKRASGYFVRIYHDGEHFNFGPYIDKEAAVTRRDLFVEGLNGQTKT